MITYIIKNFTISLAIILIWDSIADLETVPDYKIVITGIAFGVWVITKSVIEHELKTIES